MLAELQYTSDYDDLLKLGDPNIGNADYKNYWNCMLWRLGYIGGSQPNVFVCPTQ